MRGRTSEAVSTHAEMPAATELGDGIVQIRLPMAGNPLRYINGYLIEDDGGLMLVDCGWKADDVLAVLTGVLRDLGYRPGDIRRLLITHHHFDHYGLAATLRRAGVPELFMHARDWERAQGFAARRAVEEAIADAWLARNGYVAEEWDEGFSGRWELSEPTHFVADGEHIGRLEAIWTPGHAPGHLCFADARSGRMLTGDHVLDPITPHVGFWRPDAGDPMGDYLASLAKVARHGAAGALPAHGEPFADLRLRVGQIVEHTAERDRHILAAIGTGSASAGEIARRLPWTRRDRTFESLSEFHRQFAVSETIAHLEHLHVLGTLVRDAAHDPIRYSAVVR